MSDFYLRSGQNLFARAWHIHGTLFQRASAGAAVKFPLQGGPDEALKKTGASLSSE